MKCNCCNNVLYTSLERFGAPDAPLCILCWLKGREHRWPYYGPVTFPSHQECQVYTDMTQGAQLPLLETPERKAA